jgi:hypothetical protein
MAGTKRRSPTSTLVSKTSIQQASNILGGLPAKPKEIWSLREAIDSLQDQITLALDRGYTYPEISKMLTERGVEISASTLKYYLSSVRREKDPNAKTRRRRRTFSSQLDAESIALDLESGDLTAALPEKKVRKTRTPKATAEAPATTPVDAGDTEAVPTKRRGRGPAKPKDPDAAPKAPRVAKVAKAPRIAKAPRVAKAAATPKVAKAPKIAKAPKAPKAPKVAKAPKIAKVSKVAKTPKAPKAPKTTTTKAPSARGRKKAI